MESSNFAIHPLDVGGGQVALSPIPGRFGSYNFDLTTILHWAPDLVLTMTTQSELDCMGASGFGDDLEVVGVAWRHLPIVDFAAPVAEAENAWGEVLTLSVNILAQGGRILTHCFGGCGRSGMVALRLMIETGETPEGALKRLRKTRPCAVETDAQQRWAIRSSA
ncbi:MAG: protein phosphatase [Octadecabacter sp.]|nr:protein phosphatase [Octadecabacter sp.]